MSKDDQNLFRKIGFAGIGLVGLFAAISGISLSCEYGAPFCRPSIVVPVLLIAAAAVTFLALRWALMIEEPGRQMAYLVVCVGISLRAIGLFTTPILEVDYYRYIWDGKVSAIGVSPYSHSPARILKGEVTAESSYQKFVALSTKSQSNFTILQRVHFADYRTIYPPVSQYVFTAAMKWFPHSASVQAHICFIKAIMVLFDLLTMWLVFLLVKRLDFHQGWLIAYAWNPLVIKEVANSGHLDSIVSFFIILSVYFVTRYRMSRKTEQKPGMPLLGGVALGLGVGAKIFPVVLFPALFFTIARQQWSKAALFSLSFIVTSILCLYPMYLATSKVGQRSSSLVANEAMVADGKEGLSSFLTQWRMNDVIFSGIYLNLKPDKSDNAGQRSAPWFVVSSSAFRDWISRCCQSIGFGVAEPTFILTRFITLGLFALFYVWQLIRIFKEKETGCGVNFDRLTWIAAVFLFLQPTVNPWYWVWIAPLACLSRNAGWLLVAGCLMAYYCRFWFKTIEGTYCIAGTNYSGEGLFDHGLAWIEFAFIVVVLLWFYLFASKRQATTGLN